MPCDVSYMYPTHKELNASRVFTLLDEVEGGKFNRHHWSGYHPKAYNQGVSDPDLDAAVATLCSCLQSLDVSRLSLEMQMWWRDHLVAYRLPVGL